MNNHIRLFPQQTQHTYPPTHARTDNTNKHQQTNRHALVRYDSSEERRVTVPVALLLTQSRDSSKPNTTARSLRSRSFPYLGVNGKLHFVSLAESVGYVDDERRVGR